MSDAFKCDTCVLFDEDDPYYDGKPAKKYYNQDGQGRNITALELCENCSETFEELE